MSFPLPHKTLVPAEYHSLMKQSDEVQFDQRSDTSTGTFLRTLAGSKPAGLILELGTGTGISLSWILAGADSDTRVISVENDRDLLGIARSYFEGDQRVELVYDDGAHWIQNYRGPQFDLIFADAWPGKYELLEETLALLKPGGVYLIDDMLPQPNWPEGHAEKAAALTEKLLEMEGLHLTQLECSTGLMIASRKK